MFKKIILIMCVLFFLISCWSDSNTTQTKWLIEKQYTDFSISTPASWEVIADKESILPKPNQWDIELAVTSKELKWGFSNNLLILSDNLDPPTTSKDFSMLNNVWASDDYLAYTKLDSKEIIFEEEDTSILYIFEAKYNLDSPKLKFLQTAHVCNANKAFLITVAVSPTIKDTAKYEELISTFKCK